VRRVCGQVSFIIGAVYAKRASKPRHHGYWLPAVVK
jgi:hypothetical protein